MAGMAELAWAQESCLPLLPGLLLSCLFAEPTVT